MTHHLHVFNAAALVLSSGLLLGSASVETRRNPAAEPVSPPPAGAVIEVYDGTDYKDSKCTIKADVPDLGRVKSDDAKIDFGDKTASVKWNIPVGWQAVLCEDPDFKGNRHELKGTGRMESTSNLGCFNDKASSIRFEKTS